MREEFNSNSSFTVKKIRKKKKEREKEALSTP